jgi:hypothetical protein
VVTQYQLDLEKNPSPLQGRWLILIMANVTKLVLMVMKIIEVSVLEANIRRGWKNVPTP